MQKLIRTAAVLLLAALVAAPVAAQSLTGSITGSVKDEQGAVLPGVTVTLTGKQGTQVQVTDASGIYRFPALEVGAYELAAELSGFQRARQGGLQITPSRELTIDFQMKVGGFTEAVKVVGETPVVDVKSSATEQTLSQSLLYAVPISRLNAATQVLNYAPGINNQSAYGGESSSGNALLIDGVDTRDPSGGTAWTFYNYNMVEQYQFQGLGAAAEYGGFTGAVVNTITKSGGNRFSGLFDIFGTTSSWGTSNVPASIAAKNPNLADPAKTKKYVDLTTQIGGPIKTNKVFFFASAQRFLLETDPSGPVTKRHEVSPRLNFKLTLQPNASNNITGHIQYDAYNVTGRPGVSALIATDQLTNREDAPEYVWLTQWRHIFNSNTFSEVKYTGWWGFYDLNPESKLSSHTDENGLVTGSQGWFYYGDRGRHQVNASVTHYADKFGRHELKFGAEFERSRTRDRYGYNNGFTYYDLYGVPYYAYSYGYDISAHNTRQSVFAQDSWHLTNRVSANLGVRGDIYQGHGDRSNVGKVYSSSNWAPRLGVAWDVTGDNRSVVKASYGWYYEGAQTQLFTRAVPGVSDYKTYLVHGPGNLELIDDVPAVLYKVADNIKHPRVDEVTGGFERALSGSLRLSITGVWRENKNFVNSVAPDARWTPVTLSTALSGVPSINVFRWANRTASNQNFVIENVKGFQYRDPSGNVLGTVDPFRRYRALMVVLNKRFTDRWQAQASYVLSKARGNVDNTSGAQVSTRQFETPNLALVNAEGNLTNDRRHEFKLLGSYQIPRIETSVNAYLFAASGRNYTPFQQFTNSQLAANGASSSYRRPLLEPRGSRRLPKETQLDLRVEKTFSVAGSNRIGIYGDVENLFNSSGIISVLTRVPGTNVTTPTGTVTLPFETPGTLRNPRQLRLGARWSF